MLEFLAETYPQKL